MVRIQNSHFWSDYIRRPMPAIHVWMAAVRSVLIGRNGFRHLMAKGPIICLSWHRPSEDIFRSTEQHLKRFDVRILPDPCTISLWLFQTKTEDFTTLCVH